MPGAPTSVSAVAGDEQATISFSAPASSGSKPVTSFRVTASPGGDDVSGAASPLVLDDLENGTAYTFTVVAISAAGTSAGSAPSSPVTPASSDPEPLVVTQRSGGHDQGDRHEYAFSRDRGRDDDGDNTDRPVLAEATSPQGALVAFTVPSSPRGTGAATCSTRSGPVTSPAQFPLGTTVVTCRRNDRRGHAQKVSFPVIVRDTTDPVLSLPAGISATTASASGQVVSFAAAASDLVSGAVPVVCVPPSGWLFRVGVTTVVCTARDARGNWATGSFRVTVTRASADSVPPVVTVPASVAVEAAGASGALAFFPASALDAVDGARTASCAPASGSLFPLGTTTVVCTATDLAGNAGSASFPVLVADTAAPVVTAPAAPAPIEATGPAGAVVTFAAATAADAVTAGLVPVCAPASGSAFPLGTTQVWCQATDAAGNTGGAALAVTVVDTTPPVLSIVGNVTVEATGPAGASAAPALPLASDLVGGPLPVVCSTAGSFGALPLLFPLGSTVVTCAAVDAAGNTASTTFMVLVLDTTAPAIAAHADLALEATSAAGAVATYAAPAAFDLVDGALAADCVPASGSTFALGSTTVTCVAGDAAGNHAASSFAVDVDDTTPPTLLVPAALAVEATGPTTPVAYPAATATDLVDGALAAVCAPASGSGFAPGDTPVTCTAADAYGNGASAIFVVTVTDTTAPTVTAPAGLVAEATGPAGAPVSYAGASAADLVDGPLAAECLPASGSLFALGLTTATCSATDARGNTGSATFEVRVRDTTAPEVTVAVISAVNGDGTVEATGPGGAHVTVAATALDLVDGALPAGCPALPASLPLGTTTVTCTAADAAGNPAVGTLEVTVVDTTAPHVEQPVSPAPIEATGPSGAVAYWPAPQAVDTVDGAVTPACTPASGSVLPLGTTTVACTAADAAGNAASVSFSITVQDALAPIVIAPAPVEAEATGPYGAAVAYPAAAAVDVVSTGVTATCLPASGSTFPVGTTTVTCTATDAAGNTGSAATQVSVLDRTPPLLIPPAAPTAAEATSPAGAVVVYGSASAFDLVELDVPAVCLPASGSTFPVGVSTVVCVAHDSSQNTAFATTTVLVEDTTPPELSLPASLTVTSATGALPVGWVATAHDLFSGSLPVTCTPASGSTLPVGDTTVSCSAVDAFDNVGDGSFTVTVYGPPSAPRTPAAAAGDAQATVSFAAPAADGGLPVTSYTVVSSPGGKTATGAASPLTVTGLANGTSYTFTVAATNGAGTGPASVSTAAVVPVAATGPPGAPTGVSATPGNTQATVAFTPPADNGGLTITSYTVVSTPGGFTAVGAGSPITVTGLTNSVAYTFTVRATNAAGSATSAPSAAVVPATVPGAPRITAVAGSANKVTVTFTAPVSNGGAAITSYTVTSSPGGFTATGAASPIAVTGLTNGVSYTFTAKAANAIGTSVASAASTAITPTGPPLPPTITGATAGNASAMVTFTAPPNNGGSAITSYVAVSTPGSLTATVTTVTPIIVTGLTNGQAYTFAIRAVNALGSSAFSAASSPVTPATVPGAPTGASAVPAGNQATVSFTPPVSNGGSAITSYTVTSNPGAKTATGAASPLTVTGLTNGVSYTFTVRATNGLGSGPASTATAAVVVNPVVVVAKRVMVVHNTFLNADIDVTTGWALAADQSEYDPISLLTMIAAPSTPYDVIRPAGSNYLVTYDPTAEILTAQDYAVIDLGANTITDRYGATTPFDLNVIRVYKLTSDLYLIDTQDESLLLDPVTLNPVAAVGVYTVLPTPETLKLAYADLHNL